MIARIRAGSRGSWGSRNNIPRLLRRGLELDSVSCACVSRAIVGGNLEVKGYCVKKQHDMLNNNNKYLGSVPIEVHP